MHQPFILIVSGPSGVGKTTLCKRVMQLDRNLFYSVSATSRPRREGEVHGKDYYFLSPSEFENWIKEGKLLEWAKVYDNYYGTPLEPVIENFNRGKDVIMDIDVQGKRQIERNFRGRVVTVFILPPSVEELLERLEQRGAETPEQFEKRKRLIMRDLEYRWEYDYWLINDDLDKAVGELYSIIKAERLRGRYMKWQEER